MSNNRDICILVLPDKWLPCTSAPHVIIAAKKPKDNLDGWEINHTDAQLSCEFVEIDIKLLSERTYFL